MSKLLNSKNFDEEISEGNVIVDFYADWCMPCQMQSPILEALEKEISSLKVCKVDIDVSPELAQRYEVMSIPTLIILKDGNVVTKLVGLRAKSELEEYFN